MVELSDQSPCEVVSMNAVDSARAQVEAADGLGAVFEAVWDAFDVISLVADRYASNVTDSFLTWMALIPPACEGRDAIGFAPSAPSGGAMVVDLGDLAPVPEQRAAHALKELSAVCAAKLRGLTTGQVAAANAAAATRALVAAEELRAILAEGG
jgi:hypothetical protein